MAKVSKVQVTVAERAERKRAKSREKVRKRAKRAEEKAKAKAKREAERYANGLEEIKRKVDADRRKASREAERTRQRAERREALVRQRASQDRCWTVRLRFTHGVPQMFLVRITDPNPKRIPEARVALKVRAEVGEAIGLTAQGTLPGLTYREAERIHDNMARKFNIKVAKRA